MQDKLKVIENGIEKEYDVYFSCISRETNRGYLTYTDHQLNDQGEEVIYVSYYDPNVGPKELFAVTDERELQAIKELKRKVIEKAKSM